MQKHNGRNEKKHTDAREALNRYIGHTDKIRELSAPSVSSMANADEYRVRLLRNFAHIGELSRKNGKILEKHYYPLMDPDTPLNEAQFHAMRDFSDALFNAYNLNNLDIPIVYQQAERLLREAARKEDDETLIFALDGMVSASYAMMGITERLLPVDDICCKYQQSGLSAAERLLEWLDKDRFSRLSDAAKESVLINARYIRVVSELDDAPSDEAHNTRDLDRMLTALHLSDDPFYREQLPGYGWDLHIFRTLEYIASFTDLNNRRGFSTAQLRVINDCTKRLAAIYASDEARYSAMHWSKNLTLFCGRNAYLAGEITQEDYKEVLLSLFLSNNGSDQRDNSTLLVNLLAPLEYMLLLDPAHLTAEEEANLSRFYGNLIVSLHRTPKKDSLTTLLTCLSLILKHFIEVPGMDIETMGLSLIASIHPPTYVHTLSVADFAVCLTRHLLEKEPALFAGMPGIPDETSVSAHKKEIEAFVYHAALCHDFGKLMIAETILTYGRSLLGDEYHYIQAHPAIGTYLLSRHPGTAPYAEAVRGHHKWYDGNGGYPADFDMVSSPCRAAISVIVCADCLDAATDTVGRSYKDGKTFDRFLTEVHAGSGTRYAPYMAELLAERDVRAELEMLLAKGRDENYHKAYYILKKYGAE